MDEAPVWFPCSFVDVCDGGLVFTMGSQLEAQQAHLEAIRVGNKNTQVRGNQLILSFVRKDPSESPPHSDRPAD
jgi:hypothetical protein